MSELKEQLRDDEIDLYRYFMAIQRHWMVIVAVCAVAVTAMAVFALRLPKTYRVTTIVNLGQITDANTLQVRPMANISDIQQMITSGNFIRRILVSLKLDEKKFGPDLANGLVTETTNNGNSLLIRYDTSDPDLGKQILGKLVEEIQIAFNPRTENYRKGKKAQVDQFLAKIARLESNRSKAELEIQKTTREMEKKKKIIEVDTQILRNNRKSYLDQLTSVNRRIQAIAEARNKLDNLSATLQENTRELMKSKKALSQIAGRDDALASILFVNNLQQGIGFLSQDYERLKTWDVETGKAREQADNLSAQAANAEEQIQKVALKGEVEINALDMYAKQQKVLKDQEIPAEIAGLRSEIEGIDAQMELIEGIKIVSAPDYLSQPVKPNIKMMVTGSGGASLLFGILLAFVLESRRKDLGHL